MKILVIIVLLQTVCSVRLKEGRHLEILEQSDNVQTFPGHFVYTISRCISYSTETQTKDTWHKYLPSLYTSLCTLLTLTYRLSLDFYRNIFLLLIYLMF